MNDRLIGNSDKAKRGTQAEIYISNLLKEHGIENHLMQPRHPFDIFTENRLRIDVKSAWTRRPAGYSFGSKKRDKCNYTDFYILVIMVEKPVVFIVPYTAVPWDAIVMNWPAERPGKWNWQQWIDRFDLLQ
jgi:hypothetical protein